MFIKCDCPEIVIHARLRKNSFFGILILAPVIPVLNGHLPPCAVLYLGWIKFYAALVTPEPFFIKPAFSSAATTHRF